MPKESKVTTQASPSLEVEQVASEQVDTIILEDNLGTHVYNIAFDESQHRVVHARRVHTSDEYASPAHFDAC